MTTGIEAALERQKAFAEYLATTPTAETRWEDSKPGDIVGGFEVVARRVKTKRRAETIAESVGGHVWIDGPRSWAVVKS